MTVLNFVVVVVFVVIFGVQALVVDFREIMMTSIPNFDEDLPLEDKHKINELIK